MTRRDQIVGILKYLELGCGIRITVGKDGWATFEHDDAQPQFLDDAKAVISCNLRDIMLHLSDEEALAGVPALDKPDRKRNGCLGACPIDGGSCRCEKGCFPSAKNACRWCNIDSIHRPCLAVNPYAVGRHDGRMPEKNLILKTLGLSEGKVLPNAIQPDVLALMFSEEDEKKKEDEFMAEMNAAVRRPKMRMGVLPRSASVRNESAEEQAPEKEAIPAKAKAMPVRKGGSTGARLGMRVVGRPIDDDGFVLPASEEGSSGQPIARKSFGVKPVNTVNA